MELSGLLSHLSSYWISRALLTAVELNLFTYIQRGSTDISTLADTAGVSIRGLRALIPVLISMGLIAEDQKGMVLTRLGEALSEDNPHHRLGIFWHHINLWKKWSELTATVITGNPVEEDLDLESFILAMAHGKTESFDEYFGDLSFEGVHSILDLGGGPGSFSLAFLTVAEEARVTLFDLPEVIELARQILPAEVIESGRLHLLPGDVCLDSIGKDYDLIWVSSIIHSFGEDDVRMMIDKCVHSLTRGGRLVIREFFLDPGGNGPLFPALFSLNMLVNTPEGRSYTTEEIRLRMEELGLREIRMLESTGTSRMLVGMKP